MHTATTEAATTPAEHGAVGTAAEPPGGRDRAEGERDADDPRGQIRRLVVPELERSVDVHEQARIVEPVRISTATVHELPRTRHDRLLVGIEQVAERKPVLDPDEPQRSGAGQDRDERGSRPAPPGAGPRLPSVPALDRRRDVTGEVGDVSRSDDDRIDSRPFELLDLLTAGYRDIRDGELAGRNVGQQRECAVERVAVVIVPGSQ